MGDHKGSAPSATGHLIKNQHRCVFDHGSDDGHKLLLSSVQVHFVIQDRIISLGQCLNKMVQTCRFACSRYLFVRYAILAVNDSFQNRSLK